MHRYRGHRADSFVPIDVNELVELRARQRTFEGAYARTALGNLGYSLAVLKLFDRRFYHIGLLYAVLAGLLFILSFLRSQHSKHDFADPSSLSHPKIQRDQPPRIIKTVGQTGKRIFGRPFVTAGWIVLAVSCVVATVEVGLLVLVLRL
ncbi:hypothetical protein BD410DRAFT_796287 [Rickenella mellea]|uniref:DUF202 domain-containing protein n=1 Tax=Rickenella mellea TaxID=50990 RepID=A0A4Y7PHV4_9AGAM|nr:hypothetical protein BD410DRAFT_797019 [Rickenella mellea]TDL15536.1 hypothetical protein BD410DRAFT_796287 [Rickenella mellea]